MAATPAREVVQRCGCWNSKLDWQPGKNLLQSSVWDGLPQCYKMVPFEAKICWRRRPHAIIHIRIPGVNEDERDHRIDVPMITEDENALQSTYCFEHRCFEKVTKFPPDEESPDAPVIWIMSCAGK